MEEHSPFKTEIDPESISKSKEIPNEPFQATCESCEKEVTTYVKKEYNLYLLPLIFISLFFYGWLYGLIIIFILFPLFQNLTHHCPNCLSLIKEKKFFPISKNQNFLTLQFGKCVLVINFLYILILLSIIILFGLYLNISYYLFSKTIIQTEENNQISSNEFISNLINERKDLTWENFLEDCGAKVIVENNIRAIEIFKQKYYQKTIEWKGYFISAFVHHPSPSITISSFGYSNDHLVNLNIRMIPSETIKSNDIVLSMNYEKYTQYFPVLQKLVTGTPILFKGIFESIGTEWSPHHLHLVSISITNDFIESDKKVVLFKGINFDIVGHLKLQHDVEEIKERLDKEKITNPQLNVMLNESNVTIDNNTNDITINEDDKSNETKIEENLNKTST